MSALSSQFIRSNLMSPVVGMKMTRDGGANYRLADGNRFRFSRAQFEELTAQISRLGYQIRMRDPS